MLMELWSNRESAQSAQSACVTEISPEFFSLYSISSEYRTIYKLCHHLKLRFHTSILTRVIPLAEGESK